MSNKVGLPLTVKVSKLKLVFILLGLVCFGIIHAGENNILPQMTILEFGADDCFYCQKMKKILQKIQFEFGDLIQVKFVDFNNLQNYRTVHKYLIKEIPSQIFLDKESKIIVRHTGFLEEKKIREIIKEIIKKNE